MRLEFDIGNTNHKWRLLDCDAVVARGQFANTDGQGLQQLLETLSVALTQCWVSSVAAQHFSQKIDAWCQQHFAIKAEFAVVTDHSQGVYCAYGEPVKLGVDRWLVLLAAFHQYGAACVIDVGSALTVDVVSREGRQLGGYIVPGYDLLLKTLFNDTDKVRWMTNDASGGLSLGQNTAQAVTAGARLMMQRFGKEALKQVPDIASMQIIFTGGGGLKLADQFGDSVVVSPDLVFDGLAFCHREILK